MNKLVESIENYKTSLSRIVENRKLWNDATKQLIYETLIEVKELTDLDWRVQKVEIIKNQEAVNIQFNAQSSGFIETKPSQIVNYTKHGGSLVFTQAYNGMVFIIHTYPHIEGWVSELSNKLIDKIEPAKITKEIILSYVVRFLDEMAAWENSNSKTQIGYKIEK